MVDCLDLKEISEQYDDCYRNYVRKLFINHEHLYFTFPEFAIIINRMYVKFVI